MLHVEHARIDRLNRFFRHIRIFVQKILCSRGSLGEENRDESRSEGSIKKVCIEGEGSQEDGNSVVSAEILLVYVAGGSGQTLNLEARGLLLVHGDCPAQARTRWAGVCCRGGGGGVELVDDKLLRDQLSLSVGDRNGTLPDE